MVDSSSNLRHKSSPLDGPRKFYKDSALFLHRCTKPDRRGKLNSIIKMTLSHTNPKNNYHLEYLKVLQAVSIGFALMGFIGYFVKLVHIPINNIIVGGAA